MTLDGVTTSVTREAVVVAADRDLVVLASAFAGGGLARARSIVNLHVAKTAPCEDAEATIGAFARRHALAAPWVGMVTSAWTEKAEIVVEAGEGIVALVAATVGLSNASAAARTRRGIARPGTINTVLVVDADPEPAAMVNLVMTVTEVKAALLFEAGVRSVDGHPATGTSTDAVVVAATGRGVRCRFGGPISDLGWIAAGAARRALGAGIGRWLDDNR